MADITNVIGAMAESVAKSSSNSINSATAKMENAFNQHYEREKDRYFSEAHGVTVSDYNKNTYQRVAFSSEAAVKQFTQAMSEQGISAVATPFSVRGQYLAEIAKVQEDGRKATDIISDFSSTYDLRVYDEKVSQQVNETPDNSNPYAAQMAVSQMVTNATLNVFDFGEANGIVHSAVNHIQNSVYEALQPRNDPDPYGVNSNKNIFDISRDRDGNSVLENGFSSTNMQGKSKTATVIGGSTVIMDGKIVTDEKIRQNVLKQHEERLAAAQKLHDHSGRMTKKIDKINDKAFNDLEKYRNKVHNRLSKRTMNADKRYDLEQRLIAKREEKLNREAKEAIEDKFSTRLTRVTNADAILDSIYRQEYAVTVSSKHVDTFIREADWLCSWTYGALDGITNKLNTERAALLEAQRLGIKGAETGASKLIDDFKNASWLKGMDFSGEFSNEMLVEINSRFLDNATKNGYYFVGITGQFNVEKLKNLNQYDMKKLDLTKEEIDFLALVNEKGAYGGLNAFQKSLRVMGKGVGGYLMANGKAGLKLYSFAAKNSDGDGFADITELTNYAQKGARLGKAGVKVTKSAAKTTAKAVKRLTHNRFVDISKLRGKLGDTALGKSAKEAREAADRIRKMANDKASAQLARFQNSYKLKKENLFKKVGIKQNGVFGKASAAFQRLSNMFAKNPLLNALKKANAAIQGASRGLLAAAGGAVLKLGFFLQIAIVVITIVIALVDLIMGIFNVGNWFAPKTYKDTVAYNLYEDLLKQENLFVGELKFATTRDEEGLSFNWGYGDLLFGYDGKTAQEYADTLDNVELVSDEEPDPDTGELTAPYYVINPFWKINSSLPDDTAEEEMNTSYYDRSDAKTYRLYSMRNVLLGNHTYDISTNLNDYNMIDEDNRGITGQHEQVVYGVSNGHTSNIKDIIAMTDVMYQMEASEGDEELKNIMGMSPAQLDVKALGDVFMTGIKVVGQTFVNLWNWILNDFDMNQWQYECLQSSDNLVTWNTVRGYAFTLFQGSHQEYLYMTQKYYTSNVNITDESGNALEIDKDTKAALGICPQEDYIDLNISFYPPYEAPSPAENEKGEPIESYTIPEYTAVEPIIQDRNNNIYFTHLTDADLAEIGGEKAPALYEEYGGWYGFYKFDVNISVENNMNVPTMTDEERNRLGIHGNGLPCIWTDMPTYDDTIWDMNKMKHYCTTAKTWWERACPDDPALCSPNGCWGVAVEANAAFDAMIPKVDREEYNIEDTLTLTYSSRYADSDNVDLEARRTELEDLVREGMQTRLDDGSADEEAEGMFNDAVEELGEICTHYYGVTTSTMSRIKTEIFEFNPEYEEIEVTSSITSTSWQVRLPKYGTDGKPLVDEKGNTIWSDDYKTVYGKDVSATATVKFKSLYYIRETMYKYRHCKQHTFAYCGGHFDTHQQGNVFSVTNAQLALTDIYDNEGEEPSALFTKRTEGGGSSNFNSPYSPSFVEKVDDTQTPFEERYSDIIGKLNRADIDYTTAETAASTGAVASPFDDIYQGSEVAQGLNIIISYEATAEGTKAVWGVGDKLDIEKDADGRLSYLNNSALDPSGEIYNGYMIGSGAEGEGAKLIRRCRDIFDIDMIIKKGRNVFPFNDYTKYEGWTADNMTLALSRMTMDWTEVYGFDINTEIGEFNTSLSINDMEMIKFGLKNEYGARFTETRETMIDGLLLWIGRGHGTMHHHPYDYEGVMGGNEAITGANHGFLSYLCQASRGIQTYIRGVPRTCEKFADSCTAGSSIDTANFMYNFTSKALGHTYGGSRKSYDGWAHDVAGDLLPADVMVHKSGISSTGTGGTIKLNGSFADMEEDMELDGTLIRDFDLSEQAVVYIGQFSRGTIIAMQNYLKERLKPEEYYGFERDEDGVPTNFGIGYDANVYDTEDGEPSRDENGVPTNYVNRFGVRLSTGQIIYENTPIIADINKMGIYTGFNLRTYSSEAPLYQYFMKHTAGDEEALYYTGGYSKDDKNAGDKEKSSHAMNTVYYWVINPDDRTMKFNIADIAETAS